MVSGVPLLLSSVFRIRATACKAVARSVPAVADRSRRRCPEDLDDRIRAAGEDPERCVVEGIPATDAMVGGEGFGPARLLGQGHPSMALALAAVLACTSAMWAGGTKPERPLMSFGRIETTQVQRTAAALVNPVFGCRPGGFLYGNLT